MLLLLASSMATGIYNLDSSRFDAAPRDTRKEGWTEAWGSKGESLDDDDGDGDGDGKNSATQYQLDNESIASLLATPYPQLQLVLTQFRPAWMEQMALRMAKVPHIVVNSNHVTNEATGPLPYLRDHNDSLQPPILVGRNHPSNIATPNPVALNHILQYLKEVQAVDLDAALIIPEQKALSKCFLSLLQLELEPILLYLRYEDRDAWEQVYRRQYLKASSPHHSDTSWVAHLHGRFQASLERMTYRRRLVEVTRTLTITRAKERAREAYAALESQLLSPGNISTSSNGPFLLGVDGGNQPTLVDAVLWAHLADALCDVHLVVVLADFPRLVQYFQTLHQRYFKSITQSGDGSSTNNASEQWNQFQNKTNAFQQLPLQNEKKKLSASAFKDAIDLMQSLSLQHHDLQDVLETTKTKRSAEPWPTPTPPTQTLFYRWRMGEDLYGRTNTKDSQKDQSDSTNSLRQKLIRDQMRNDQIWISGMLGVSAVAILLLQGNLSGKEK